MPSNPYKSSRSERTPEQKLQVWQLRLDAILQSIETEADAEATKQLEQLRAELVPEAYPEFADNLDWLYRSAVAHLADGQRDGAAKIITALNRMLALAKEQPSRSKDMLGHGKTSA